MRSVDVAIVGAGIAGIAAASALKKEATRSFLVIERAADVGGTWRDNTYPGIACDVPAHLYGLAAHPNPSWSATHAPGSEIRAYLENVVTTDDLWEHISLGNEMRSARWDAEASSWLLTTDQGTVRADTVILACGRLTEPFIPPIPGLSSFPGPMFHTARWNHDVDLADARVAVVGSGASAVQVTPEITRRAGEVVLFQRSAPWILPRESRAFRADEVAEFTRNPDTLARFRKELLEFSESQYASRSGASGSDSSAQTRATAHLAAQVADPALREALSPGYPFGCKRVLFSDDFYPALASSGVQLESSALAEVRGNTLIAENGASHDVDIVVLATGFLPIRQTFPLKIHGEGGLSLADHWSERIRSYASTMVSGFPNLFIINGPNATLAHNSAVLMIEAQVDFVVRTLRSRDDAGASTIRVRASAESDYGREIESAGRDTSWLSGCTSWYIDTRSGLLGLLWPGTFESFRSRLAREDPDAMELVGAAGEAG